MLCSFYLTFFVWRVEKRAEKCFFELLIVQLVTLRWAPSLYTNKNKSSIAQLDSIFSPFLSPQFLTQFLVILVTQDT